jgi:hypothetical protein
LMTHDFRLPKQSMPYYRAAVGAPTIPSKPSSPSSDAIPRGPSSSSSSSSSHSDATPTVSSSSSRGSTTPESQFAWRVHPNPDWRPNLVGFKHNYLPFHELPGDDAP